MEFEADFEYVYYQGRSEALHELLSSEHLSNENYSNIDKIEIDFKENQIEKE